MNKFVCIAVSIAGGQRATGRALGVSNTAVSNWVKKGRIPVGYCEELSKLAEHMVTPRQLNPEYKS